MGKRREFGCGDTRFYIDGTAIGDTVGTEGVGGGAWAKATAVYSLEGTGRWWSVTLSRMRRSTTFFPARHREEIFP